MLRNHLDPNNHNGAVFLGLNGVVVKSHGSADEKGVANAVEVAARLVEDSILERISEDLSKITIKRILRPKLQNERPKPPCVLSSRAPALPFPRTKVSNAELAAKVDTSDEWIVERTGIRFRHIAEDDETTSSLATEAAVNRRSGGMRT